MWRRHPPNREDHAWVLSIRLDVGAERPMVWTQHSKWNLITHLAQPSLA